MLSPILEAVKEVYTKPGKKFIFGPEGEMGGTVFYAPESYQKVRTAGRVGGGARRRGAGGSEYVSVCARPQQKRGAATLTPESPTFQHHIRSLAPLQSPQST